MSIQSRAKYIFVILLILTVIPVTLVVLNLVNKFEFRLMWALCFLFFAAFVIAGIASLRAAEKYFRIMFMLGLEAFACSISDIVYRRVVTDADIRKQLIWLFLFGTEAVIAFYISKRIVKWENENSGAEAKKIEKKFTAIALSFGAFIYGALRISSRLLSETGNNILTGILCCVAVLLSHVCAFGVFYKIPYKNS